MNIIIPKAILTSTLTNVIIPRKVCVAGCFTLLVVLVLKRPLQNRQSLEREVQGIQDIRVIPSLEPN